MTIISARGNENNKWKRNAKQKKETKTKKNMGEGSYSKRVRPKWFCWAFKLGFLQLICKASLIFKSNLELALSIILKERTSIRKRLLRNLFIQTAIYYWLLDS